VNGNPVRYCLPLMVLVIIYYPLFYSHYLYLDDAHQLWYNEKGKTLEIWRIHGRLLGGVLMEKAFTSFRRIDSVIILRIISVLGWALAICFYIRCAQQWVQYNLIDKRLVLLSGVYIACSLSLGIYNGWGGTCFEVFIAFIPGLCSGHLLFTQLKKHHRYWAIPIPVQLLILLLGIVSLFIYQIGVGAFMLPFFLHYINNRFKKPDAIVITGSIANLVIFGVYFLLFKALLHLEGFAASDRTEIAINPLQKISFFFSVPTAQAFSFNFPYNPRSIISQAFYILAIVIWVIYLFTIQRQQSVGKKLRFIVGVFLLLMLIYLPGLATKESFSSYRTMLNLNLAGFFLLTGMLLEWTKTERGKDRLAWAAMAIFAVMGFYNFRINFLNPIIKEYRLVRNYVEQHYTANISKIYFLRPPENLYRQQYHIHYYRDEFGVPLTFKDWVPEPLVKQIIYEKIHDKEKARSIEMIQFEDREAFHQQTITQEPNSMVIDVATLFNNAK
jgi:hypothetical protein